eukprot:15452346-Alexandrium_andersonii.AAC.1
MSPGLQCRATPSVPFENAPTPSNTRSGRRHAADASNNGDPDRNWQEARCCRGPPVFWPGPGKTSPAIPMLHHMYADAPEANSRPMLLGGGAVRPISSFIGVRM